MGRPAKYTTEEERRKARCEAVKKCNKKKKETEEPKEKLERGRPRKHFTEEEIKEAHRIATKKNYEKNKPERAKVGRPKIHITEEQIRVAKCEKTRKYYETNYKMISAQRKQYYQDNKEKIKSRVKYQMKKPENLTEMINFLNELWKKRPINTRAYIPDKDVRDDLKETYEEIKRNYNEVPFTLQQFYEAFNQIEFYTLENATDKEFTKKYKEYYKPDLLTEHTAVYYFVHLININKFNEGMIKSIRQRLIT